MRTFRRVAYAVLALTSLQACGSAPSTGPASTPTETGSTPTHHKVDVRLELSSMSVKAGTPIHATLILDNLSGKPITSGCGLLYTAGLANDAIAFTPAVPAMCQTNQQLAAGITRYPTTIVTTYQSCSQSGQADGTTPGCLPGPMGAGSRFTISPPLPQGTYRTVIVIDGLDATAVGFPAPITVTLTP